MEKILKYKEKIFLFIILLIASFYRLYMIRDYMTFLGDEGRDVLVVYNILHGNLTLLGPTASVGGFFLGPIYYYFMAPFLFLTNYDPVGPAIMVALFGIATVFLTYKVGKEFFGPVVGLIAAGLYSISPLVVTYSRSSWNPNPMPFFSLLTLYLVYKALKRNSIKLFLLAGFLLGIALQLHYLALFLGVIVFFYVLVQNLVFREKNLFTKITKQYLIMFVGFIIGWLPFLGFEVRHGFPNLISIFNFIFHSGDTGGSNNTISVVGDVFFRVFGRLTANFPSQEQKPLGNELQMNLWYYAVVVLAIVSVSFLFFKFSQSFKNKSSNFSKISLLVIWFVFGIGLFGFYKKPIYDYYFGFMFPLPFLILSYFIVNIWNKKFGKIIGVSIALILVFLNSLTLPFKAPANRQLDQVKKISQFVVGKADNKPFNFALIAGGNSDHAYRYFFKIWNKDPITIENKSIDPNRNTVTDQLFVICEMECHPLGYSLWEIAGFGRAEIAKEWDVSVVKVYRLTHYKGDEN